MVKELQTMDFEKNRKTILLSANDHLFWVIFTKYLNKNQYKIGAVMARTNIKNISHDFDLTNQKFTVKFKSETSEFSESRHLLWDTTLINSEYYLHMKRFVIAPCFPSTHVSINILSTLKKKEIV